MYFLSPHWYIPSHINVAIVLLRSRVKEYLPIVGLAEFNKLSAKLILGADRLDTAS